MFLLTICVSSLEKYVLTIFAYFKNINIWVFLLLSFFNIFCILTTYQMGDL